MTNTQIKLYLYKNKGIASFKRYCAGNIYYSVRIEDDYYEFPINTVEDTTLVSHAQGSSIPPVMEVSKKEYEEIIFDNNIFDVIVCDLSKKEVKTTRLSSDLGTTDFLNEMKASELIRWITKANDAGLLIKS